MPPWPLTLPGRRSCRASMGSAARARDAGGAARPQQIQLHKYMSAGKRGRQKLGCTWMHKGAAVMPIGCPIGCQAGGAAARH
eukprot:1149306-Pelagomonas_calceolata.AAC.5